MPSGRKQGL